MKVVIEIEHGRYGLPQIAPQPGARLRAVAHGRQVHISGNREGLLLLARSAVALAELEQSPEHAGFHIHLDDLYALNADGSELMLYRDE